MNPVIRSLTAALVAAAACWYIYWVPVAIALELSVGRFRGMWIIRVLGSLAAAAGVAQYTWWHSSWVPQGLLTCMAVSGVIIGGLGFAAGWFGPMIFDPGSQGPVIAIVTGPLGFLVGSIGGAFYWAWRGKRKEASAAANTRTGYKQA